MKCISRLEALNMTERDSNQKLPVAGKKSRLKDGPEPDYAEARNNLAHALEMKNAPAGR